MEKINKFFERIKTETINVAELIENFGTDSKYGKLFIAAYLAIFAGVVGFWIWFIFFMPLVPSA